ncbi:siderophore ABC transporter substrate-binding protein [Arthrobacter sp. AQ5-05]|uniref:siderophore ABC transporter substrate-binding protein n=1 Tax=Arthrobacter sp. AQ5-05 TaxID=2184581 RepID=UPI0012B67B78|nr:siderophore ABC transporter substrate-binding protein [Arthrobacter sp. AQ5-05]
MLKKSLLTLAAATAAMLALASCGQGAGAGSQDKAAGTVSITHAQGTQDVPLNPAKVYTFDLGVLDTLDALDVPVSGIPQVSLPASLTAYGSPDIQNIGTMKEPDFEAISAGAPDLIISGRTAGSYAELSKIAPTIDLSISAKAPMDSFKAATASLGQIFGKEAEVAAKIAAIDTKVAATKATAPAAGTGLIVMTSGGELTAYGAGSRFGLIHDVLGVPTAAEVKAEGSHGEAISFEYIAKSNPGSLYVIDRDVAMGESKGAAEAVLNNALVKGTDAAKNSRISYLDPASWYLIGYGLNNVDAMVDAVATSVAKA